MNQKHRAGEKCTQREISLPLCQGEKQNGNLFAQQSLHAAIRTDWPWLKPNTSALPSPRLPNKTKMLLSSREEEADISALWWICWPRPGLAFSAGWFDYGSEILYIATGVLWKFKSSYIISSSWSQHIAGARTHAHMHDTRAQRLCSQTPGEFSE